MTTYLDEATTIPCAIWFSEIPPTAYATNKPITPFMVSISAFDTGPHVIDLYAQYSQSHVYQTPQQKWSHLIPQWRFLDLDDNVIERVTTTDTIVYSGSQAIGVTGYAQFNFIDDIGSSLGFPIILWATMQVSGLPVSAESHEGLTSVPSFANSKVATFLPFAVNQLVPYELHITRNGIDEMSISPYWVGQNVPALITVHGNNVMSACTTNFGTNVVYTYPSSNQVGFDVGQIEKAIITVPTSAQHWTTIGDITSAAYFQAIDKNYQDIRGYSRNTVLSDNVTLQTNITAGVNAKFPTPFTDLPFMWVPQPNDNKLYRFFAPYVDQSIIASITSWLQAQNFNTILSYNTPYVTEQFNVMSLTGFGGIYGVAADQCYNIWASDGEMDKLYKFSFNGALLSTIDLGDDSSLSAIGVSGGCTPAGLSLDSANGLWVSLYDSVSVLKFDRTTGQLLTAINPEGNQISPIGGYGVDMDYTPTIAETDQDNNVWVSYTNTLCCYLNKYDDMGNLLVSVTLPTCANPMDILIDYDNNVWTSLTFHAGPPYLQGSALHIDTNGVLLTTVAMPHPEYLTMDKDANIWVTYGFNQVKKIQPNGATVSFTVGTTTQPSWYNPLSTLEYNCLEGIGCDGLNRVWVINAYDSQLYVISGNQIQTSYPIPSSGRDWYLDDNLNIISVSSQWAKSMQAFGDWTGIRFFQKYLTESMLNSTYNVYLSGISDTFDILSFSGLDVRKFNESWDATTQIRNYALPEHFYNDENLFLNYIGTMIGGLDTSAHSIARLIYERTANFVANHNDVDTSNIPQLYALAQEINAPIDDYNFEYPSDMKRIMDIVSIPHKVLWGDRCKCNMNFRGVYGYCSNCGHKHNSNVGAGIDTDTYVVSANVPFLAQYKFLKGQYDLITPLNSSTSIFTEASAFLINDPHDYCYAEYDPTFCSIQDEGVISWDDPYTTLSENSSGLDEWYKNGGIVEKMINYYLHKGLGF